MDFRAMRGTIEEVQTRSFLPISILVNLLLLGLASWALLRGGPVSPSKAKVLAEAPVGDGDPLAGTDEAGRARVLAAAWAAVYSDNADTFAARLRQAGVSERQVRWLLTAQVYEQVEQARLRQGSTGERPFWERNQSEEALGEHERELFVKADTDLKRLLGKGHEETAESFAQTLRSEYGNLPDEKVERIRRITEDYDELRRQVTEAAGEVVFPEDRRRLELLEKEQKSDTLAVLSPEEREEYELRSSDTAGRLRSGITGVAVSEAEYRRLFQLQRTFDEKWNVDDLNPGPEENPELRDVAQKQLDAEYRRIMGEERYAAYERANDYAYKVAGQIVTRLKLPEANVEAVYRLRQLAERRIQELQENQNLSDQDRKLAARQLHKDVSAQLDHYLSEKGSEVYRENGGYWVGEVEAFASDKDKG